MEIKPFKNYVGMFTVSGPMPTGKVSIGGMRWRGEVDGSEEEGGFGRGRRRGDVRWRGEVKRCFKNE